MEAPKNLSTKELINYYSLSKFGQFMFHARHFFPTLIQSWKDHSRSDKRKIINNSKKAGNIFETIGSSAVNGSWSTKLSLLLMGFGLIRYGQIFRGLLYLAFEICFIAFLSTVGVYNLKFLPTLGQLGKVEYSVVDPNTGLDLTVTDIHNDSFTILLYSLITIFLMALFVILWFAQLKETNRLERMNSFGFALPTDKDFIRNIFDKNYHRTLLALPMTGLVCFTIIPILMMILIAFTNFDYNHYTPANLFDWVGLNNFETVFSSSTSSNNSLFLEVFGKVLLWTLIWAFFATFTNYFLGMFFAILINMKGIKLKKLWRTVLVTTIPIPQFVSLLLMSRILSQNGVLNNLLQDMNWVGDKGIPWLTDPLLSKVMIVLVNSWIGIPYTLLICTGLLLNIPQDLYESAKIDGANAFQTYWKITFPYMIFVTTPYLISQFIFNINNFNMIYLMTQGGPSFVFYTSNIPYQISSTGVGQTDILITWIYKMTVTTETKDYGSASVIGILIALVVGVFSLSLFSNSRSIKNEKDFQ